MKHILLTFFIALTANCLCQATVEINGNRHNLNLDLYALMDTLHSLRADIDSAAAGLGLFGNSQRATSYRVIEAVNATNNAAYVLNGYTILYKTEEIEEDDPKWNYRIRVHGDKLASVSSVDLAFRGVDLTTEEYDLMNDPTWTDAWTSEQGSDSTMILKVGYTNLVTALTDESNQTQEDGFLDCSLILDGFNSGLVLKFYLDSSNEAPTLSSFEY